ncbi:MAG: hypothetical protein LBF44_02395 [Holosporaceae bacterium]|nr:hypothetical protein [Holosporaceae bacterium]
MEKTHYEYNDAAAKANNKQLLLNLIRPKYRDSFSFVEITSIAENRKFTTRIGPSGSKIGLDKNGGHTDLGILAYGEDSQSPLINYSFLSGEQFTKRMISPIPLTTVLGLVQAGWSISRVFSLCFECFNHLGNAGTASGPTPTKKPDYESFAEAVDLIEALYNEKHLLIGLHTENRKNLILKFTNSDPQSQALKSLLGVNQDSSEFCFCPNFLDIRTDLIVRTRSVIEILFYLSHAVCVPQTDIDAGLVTVTKDSAGKIFDWSKNLSGKWISIHCFEGREQPKNAFVSIFYRGKWFYIADNDLNSKSTFMFLNQLFNLQSGNSTAPAPTLVIPKN